MKTFNIIKRNRKYFAAQVGRYDCKILIDENSENLQPGEQELQVDDISVRSKYGTDLIFRLSAPADQQKSAGICTLVTPYNLNCIDKCHKLGGKWDSSANAWVFSSLVANEVEELDEKYNSTPVGIEVTVIKPVVGDAAPAYIAGFKIAQSFDRDSGARIADGISFVSGEPRSGGSRKNWITAVPNGCVFRMSIPSECISDIDTDYFDVKTL